MKTPTHSNKLKFAVLATDVALFTAHEGRLMTLLMTVNRPPHFDGVPGFPGGVLLPDETADECASRQLVEKGGIDAKHVYMEQLATFSEIGRDPRGRVVAVAYLALMPSKNMEFKRGSGAYWQDVSAMPRLAYDHDDMLKSALKRLRSKVEYTNLIGQLMPAEFTLSELQATYETVLGRKLDKRNFRKKIRDVGLVKPTGKKRGGGAHRPAELYAMADKKVRITEIF